MSTKPIIEESSTNSMASCEPEPKPHLRHRTVGCKKMSLWLHTSWFVNHHWDRHALPLKPFNSICSYTKLTNFYWLLCTIFCFPRCRYHNCRNLEDNNLAKTNKNRVDIARVFVTSFQFQSGLFRSSSLGTYPTFARVYGYRHLPQLPHFCTSLSGEEDSPFWDPHLECYNIANVIRNVTGMVIMEHLTCPFDISSFTMVETNFLNALVYILFWSCQHCF